MKVVKVSVALCAMSLVLGCSLVDGGGSGGGAGSTDGGGTAAGAGGGGGGTGGTPTTPAPTTPTPADFDARFTNNQLPTTVPLSGTASYAGRIKVMTSAHPEYDADMYGDLNLDVDLSAQTGTVNNVSGTAGNFAGTVNGQDVKLAGTLSTANVPASDPNVTSVQTTPIPIVGGTITQTGITMSLGGTLDDATGTVPSGPAYLSQQGVFYGPNGETIKGSGNLILGAKQADQKFNATQFVVDQ